jgi:hypothetical protein
MSSCGVVVVVIIIEETSAAAPLSSSLSLQAHPYQERSGRHTSCAGAKKGVLISSSRQTLSLSLLVRNNARRKIISSCACASCPSASCGIGR